MTTADVLRYVVAGLAALVSGAMLTVLAVYVRAAFLGYRGSLLVRHVVEVTAGTLGLVATAAIGVYDALPGVTVTFPDADQRLWLYLPSMLLLLVAMLDVGRHTRRRARRPREPAGPPADPPYRHGRHQKSAPRGNRHGQADQQHEA